MNAVRRLLLGRKIREIGIDGQQGMLYHINITETSNESGGSFMKNIRKITAILLAAVMALTMLTACGGGSGSSRTEKERYVAGINDYLNHSPSLRRLKSYRQKKAAVQCKAVRRLLFMMTIKTARKNDRLQVPSLSGHFLLTNLVKGWSFTDTAPFRLWDSSIPDACQADWVPVGRHNNVCKFPCRP